MKRVLCLILSIVCIFSLSACSKTEKDPQPSAAPVTSADNGPDNTEVNVSNGDIDVDLTALSSTMVYSEVYNMVTTPNDYRGKKIKMNGSFSAFYSEDTKRYYFACLIADATACCSQGLEFVLADERSFPNDYPAVKSDITVEGIFDTYIENGTEYYQLINAKFV